MIQLVIAIEIIGLIVWAVITYIPMPVGFKRAIVIVAIVCVGIYLLRAFGLWGGSDVPVPNLRSGG